MPVKKSPLETASDYITLHGLYDFEKAITTDDAKIGTGGVTYNQHFDEVAIKVGDSWYFIEDGNAKEKDLRDCLLALGKSTSPPNLTDIRILTRIDEEEGLNTLQVLDFKVDKARAAPPVVKIPVEKYQENDQFGQF